MHSATRLCQIRSQKVSLIPCNQQQQQQQMAHVLYSTSEEELKYSSIFSNLSQTTVSRGVTIAVRKADKRCKYCQHRRNIRPFEIPLAARTQKRIQLNTRTHARTPLPFHLHPPPPPSKTYTYTRSGINLDY